MTDDRRDPSDFTGNTDKNQGTEETDETAVPSGTSTEDEVEKEEEMLEPEDDGPNGPFWTLKGTVEGVLSRGSDEGSEPVASAGDEEGYTEDDYTEEESYDDEGVNRRWFLYAIGGLGAAGAGALAADGADGEIDGEFDAFDGFFGGAPPAANETQTPQDTPDGVVTDDQTPIDTPEGTPEGTPDQTPDQTQTPPSEGDIYFNNYEDLPSEACWTGEVESVSGYFDAEDIEDVLGEEAIQGLNPSRGDIAYDVDFRDSDGDGQRDAYVIQLAGTDDQNDLTTAQAETLFEELDVDGSYC